MKDVSSTPSTPVAFLDFAIVPHATVGAPECNGCLMSFVRPFEADLICDGCSVLIGTVPIGRLNTTLLRMLLNEGCVSAVCPYCAAVNAFPGLDAMLRYRCRECGESVKVEG